MRLLPRLGLDPPARHLPVLALELVLVVGPAAHDVPDGLLPHLAALGGVDAEALELGPGRRTTRAHVDPTLRQEVEHRHRLRRAHGVVVRLGHEADAVAEADVLGPRCDGAVEDLGVRAVRVLLQEVVLDGPEGVPAELVAGDGLLQRVLVRDELAVLLPGAGDGDLVEQRELHGWPPPGTVLPGTPGLEQCTAPISPARPGATKRRRYAWIGRPDLHRDGGRFGHRPRHGGPTLVGGGPRRRGRSRSADEVPRGDDGEGRWLFPHVDVADEASVAALVQEAVAFGGSIEGLVNAAGVAGGGPVHMLPAQEWNRVIAVNLTGTYLTAKHVIAQMLSPAGPADGQRGSVVTVASIEGLEGTAGGSAYSASKGGVVHADQEHGHRLRRARHPGQRRLPGIH